MPGELVIISEKNVEYVIFSRWLLYILLYELFPCKLQKGICVKLIFMCSISVVSFCQSTIEKIRSPVNMIFGIVFPISINFVLNSPKGKGLINFMPGSLEDGTD